MPARPRQAFEPLLACRPRARGAPACSPGLLSRHGRCSAAMHEGSAPRCPAGPLSGRAHSQAWSDADGPCGGARGVCVYGVSHTAALATDEQRAASLWWTGKTHGGCTVSAITRRASLRTHGTAEAPTVSLCAFTLISIPPSATAKLPSVWHRRRGPVRGPSLGNHSAGHSLTATCSWTLGLELKGRRFYALVQIM